MGARPGEWHLVGRDGDPVPGDPDEVDGEAGYYRRVANEISGQVDRLRALSEPDAALKGYYADELRQGMEELAKDLDKAHDRFATAGSELAKLAPALESARTRTKTELDNAVDAENSKKADGEGGDDGGLFEKSDEEEAVDRIMADFDLVADGVAGKIRAASDDDMKDSTWDKFKNMVEAVAPVLKIIAKVLTYAALVLSFFVAPWIIALLLVGALLIHVTLAATDNGSWSDVAWDAVGLLTLGIGTKALAIAKAGRATTLTRAARPAARAARSDAFARTAWNGGRGLPGLLSRLRPSVRTAMRSAYADEFARVTSRPLPQGASGVKSLLRGGMNPKVAGALDDLRAIRAEYPGVRVALQHSGGVRLAQYNAATSSTLSAQGIVGDAVDLGKLTYSKVTN